jgi:hypothetical protein
MTHKCYRRDPDVNAVTDLVTDEQMQSVFQGTNFGHTDYRGLLAKAASWRWPPGTRVTR